MANMPLVTQSTNVDEWFQAWQEKMENKQEEKERRMQSLLWQGKQLKQEKQELWA